MITREEFEAVQNRLLALERRHRWVRLERWLWRCGFLLTLAIGGYLIMLESGYRVLPTPQTVNCKYVTTQGLLLNDADGKKRAVLGTSDNGIPSLSFWSPDDQILTVIGASEKGGVAKFLERGGKANVLTGFYTDGGAGLHIQDGKDVHRGALFLNPNGSFLVLRDAVGNVTYSKP